jgi:hypothetical protein
MRRPDTRLYFAAALLAVAIVLAGCGGQATTSSASPNSGTSPAASAPAGGSGTVIHLVITGGSGAGTYDVSSADPCTYLKTNKIWNARFGDPTSTTVVSVTIAADTSVTPAQFTFDVQTGSSSGPVYDISTVIPGHGSGNIDIQDSGTTAKLTVTGTTTKGEKMTATAQCNQVDRPQG